MNMNKRQLGISMVEILVALVISLFLLAGVVQVYTGNKATYTFTDTIARMQENGRFALDTISQDLRMAGFWGCAIFDPDDTDNLVNNLDPAGTNYNNFLHDVITEGALDGTENDGMNGSDSLTLRGSSAAQVNVKPPFNVATSSPIEVSVNGWIDPDDIIMVSNCRGADIFQVTGVNPGTAAGQVALTHRVNAGQEPGNHNPDTCPGVDTHCLSQTYGSDSAVFRLQTVTYTIAPSADAGGEPALWRSENGNDEELIVGIEEMQILYGVDTDDDRVPNRYRTSNNVTDMNDVIAVRVMLLVRSENDFVADGPATYTFNGQTVTPADRRLRQVFSTTIALRNRVGS